MTPRWLTLRLRGVLPLQILSLPASPCPERKYKIFVSINVNYFNIDQHFFLAYLKVSTPRWLTLRGVETFQTLGSNIIAKTKKFAKPFLSVHMGPKSNLLSKRYAKNLAHNKERQLSQCWPGQRSAWFKCCRRKQSTWFSLTGHFAERINEKHKLFANSPTAVHKSFGHLNTEIKYQNSLSQKISWHGQKL